MDDDHILSLWEVFVLLLLAAVFTVCLMYVCLTYFLQ